MSILHKIESHYKFKTKVIWKNVLGMFTLHVIALYGLFLIPTAKIATLFWVIFVHFLAGVGISCGAHRLWTHRAYEANQPMRAVLMVFFLMTGQYSLVQWARDHRTHHLYTDSDADPYSAGRGLFFSHVGWLLMKRHPDNKLKGMNADLSDMYRDPVIQFHQKHFFLLSAVVHVIFPSAFAYYVIGETWWNSVFIVFFLRTVFSLNMVWCLNSLAHYQGPRPYDKNVLATQHTLLAILLIGEGWHNYHHAFPFDYRLGEVRHYFKFGAWVIDVCAKYGWATNMRSATQVEIERAIEKNKIE